MNPWLLGQMRLAERRGLLQGKLSPVQEIALMVIMRHEAIAAGKAQEKTSPPRLPAGVSVPEDTVVVEVTEENLDDPGTVVFDTTTEDVESVMKEIGLSGQITS